MSIYGNEYEIYYRNLKKGSTVDKNYNKHNKRKIKSSKKNMFFNILIYDLTFSCLILVFVIMLKNVNSQNSNYIYNIIKNEFNKEDKALNYYNDNIVSEIKKLYCSIFESNSDGVQKHE